MNESWFGKVRIRGESPAGKTLFIGIGPQAEVARYLGSVAQANVQDLDFDPFRVTYLPVTGRAPQAPPTEQSFWAASASGVGTQTLTWKVRDGDWSVVLMNADGSRGVTAHVDLGAKLCRSCSGLRSGCSSAGCSSPGEAPRWSCWPREDPGRRVHRRSLLTRAADQEVHRHPSLPPHRPNSPRPAERSRQFDLSRKQGSWRSRA